MTVMYANALYQRGFVKEGYRALYTLLEQAMNTPVSLMYPGIPEYFDADGKGKYPYLTGSQLVYDDNGYTDFWIPRRMGRSGTRTQNSVASV